MGLAVLLAAISKSGRLNCKASVYNYKVQSLATAEIIPIALCYLWFRLRELEDKVMIVNTVHDSVVMEIAPEVKDTVAALVSKSFSSDVYRYLKKVYGIEFDVPLSSEFKCGTHWGD